MDRKRGVKVKRLLTACYSGDEQTVQKILQTGRSTSDWAKPFYVGTVQMSGGKKERVTVHIKTTPLVWALKNYTPSLGKVAVIRRLLNDKDQLRASPAVDVTIISNYKENGCSKVEETKRSYSLWQFIQFNYQKSAGKDIPVGLDKICLSDVRLVDLLKERYQKDRNNQMASAKKIGKHTGISALKQKSKKQSNERTNND